MKRAIMETQQAIWYENKIEAFCGLVNNECHEAYYNEYECDYIAKLVNNQFQITELTNINLKWQGIIH